VIGTALHDDVAGSEMHILLIQHHRNLAGKHDRKIDSFGTVHEAGWRLPLAKVDAFGLPRPAKTLADSSGVIALMLPDSGGK